MKFFAIILAAIALLGAVGATGRKENGEIIAAYEQLIEKDLRLATVGFHLARANAPYCRNQMRNPGWVLHDIAQYGDAENARVAFDFRQPVAVAAVVEGGPAAQAGIVPGDGLAARNGQQWEWAQSARMTSRRIDTIRAELQTILDRDGRIAITLATRAGERKLTISPDPVCISDFWVDVRPKRDAGADGVRVRVTSGLIDYVQDDDELAAVVAHEMAHNLLDHRPRINATKKGKTSVIKDTEEEADRLSVWLMANAGYDPEAAITFWERYGKETGLGIFSAPTHYRWQTRVTMLREEIDKMASLSANAGRRDPPLLAAHRDKK